MSKRTTVCLCGSTRFYEAFQKANYDLTMEGKIVLSVGFYMHTPSANHGEGVGCTDEQKVRLDELHKDKIDRADEILVLNVGGYIGSSTRSEIEHAKKTDTRIRYLEGCEFCGEAGPTHEKCRAADDQRSRYEDSFICPYCAADNGESTHEVQYDDDEHQLQCFSCEKFFYAFTILNMSYRIERSDDSPAIAEVFTDQPLIVSNTPGYLITDTAKDEKP